MKSGLKKSLYFGLAAVSVLATAGFATKADAASYAKVTSNKTLTTVATSRNVAPNGTNALYTKAGTLKGAKVVASKSTMAGLASSKSSKNYFRAYQVATTNRGSVYYKIVSFDGKYRGWIYGGKSTSAFGGGISAVNTTKSAALPAATTGYTIKDVKSNTLWNYPGYTQYKASKVNMNAYKSTDTFTVKAAETKAREGSLYYQVTDDQTPSITGWIYAGGLKSDAAVGNVTINYDNAAGQVVGTYNWGVPASALKSGAATTTGTKLSDILTDPTSVWSTAVKNVPAGYTVTNSSTVADNATLGGSFSVQVIPANTAQTVSFFSTGSGQALVGTTNPTLSAADKALLSGKTGETIPASTWTSAAFLPGGDLYSIANPNGGTYTFDAATTAQRNTTYTGNITLFYK